MTQFIDLKPFLFFLFRVDFVRNPLFADNVTLLVDQNYTFKPSKVTQKHDLLSNVVWFIVLCIFNIFLFLYKINYLYICMLVF